jgi:hypothetical protein
VKILAADSFEPIFEPLLGRRVGYVPTSGGVGDLLVEMAALQLFAHFGVDYHVETLGGECEADLLVLAGGGPGPLCPEGLDGQLAELAAMIPVTLLPRSLAGPTGIRLRRCHVRERWSLTWEPAGIVMPDLILGLEVAAPREAAKAEGLWLRCDEDGLFAGHGLGDPDLVCGTAVEYLALAARFRSVITDRAEFALAALVQGREATLLPSASPFNRSLFETWLGDLGCRWIDANDVSEDGTPAVARGVRMTAGMLPAGVHAGTQPAFQGDPRRAERAVARCDAGIRALDARLTDRDRELDEIVVALVASQEKLFRRIDDLQESLYALRSEVRLRATAEASEADDREKRVAYNAMVARIRALVRDRLPADAAVLVVSRGDDDLLQLYGRRAGHFPQTESGVYAGHHPPDAAAAVAQLQPLAVAGWEYLIVPATSNWWLDHYAGFAAHLRRSAAVVHNGPECVIFALHEPSPWQALASFVARFKTVECRQPAILDWGTNSGLAAAFPELPVFAPFAAAAPDLPYVDESIDVVAVPQGDATRMNEARRVATAAVVEIAAATDVAGGVEIIVHPLGRHATGSLRTTTTGKRAL